MSGWKKLAAASAAGGDVLNVEDLFSTYLTDALGAGTHSINNGIDLSGEGGMVWGKARTATAASHEIVDTERGISNGALQSNSNNAAGSASTDFSSFTSTGFQLSSSGSGNLTYYDAATWTFRKAPKFFDVVTYTGDGTTGRQISHNLDATVGMMFLKETSGSGYWGVYHRSVDSTSPEDYVLILNSTSARIDEQFFINDTAPTSTHFTVGAAAASGGDFNTNGDTYVAYLFAHNDSDGNFGPTGDQDIIKCGSYTGNGSTDGPEIDLGFEPQWVIVKNTSSSGDWYMFDNMRGMTVDSTDFYLRANRDGAEDGSQNYISVNPNGFQVHGTGGHTNASGTYIYMAIRRGPMAVPENGTDVFDVVTRTGNSTNTTVTMNQSFTSDWIITKERGSGGGNTWLADRLRGIMNAYQGVMYWNSKAAESTAFSSGLRNAYEGEYEVGTTSGMNNSGDTFVDWHWKRAPQFFDIVAYSGNGVSSPTHQISHNLGVTPEILMLKCRNKGTEDWYLRFGSQTFFPGFDVAATNSTLNITMTDSYFTAPGNGTFNNATSNYIAYLFASLDGVSKIGTYTGNGSNQTIDCGFSAGARFILIKRTDSTGDWYVWDTERGIVAGNDPHLSLHTTSAEVTTNDSIDPNNTGFVVNQVTATNINVSSATYLFYAIA